MRVLILNFLKLINLVLSYSRIFTLLIGYSIIFLFESLLKFLLKISEVLAKYCRRIFHLRLLKPTFLSGVLFAFIFVFFPFKIFEWYVALPNTNDLIEMANRKSTKILDRNGNLLYEIYVDRQYDPVTLSNIPDNVIKSTLAIEDAEFYNHHGIRPLSMMRAAKASLVDDNLQGASTITQQLVKNVLLTPERTIPRKIKEAVLALIVETKYSKDKILELYLNNISYGGTAWGVQSASQKYFGKNVQDLNLAEASLIAGLPTAPSIYSPANGDLNLTKERQAVVLNRMVKLGYITQVEADAAFATPINIVSQKDFIKAPHFVAYIRDQLESLYGKRDVENGGLTVTTTLDLSLQDQAQQVVNSEVEANKKLNINNGAALVLEAQTGDILAYVGSRNYFYDTFGAYDSIMALRQPGSAIKPITYALALQNGYTPATIIKDAPFTYKNQWETYTPVNYDGKYHGDVTLRSALANSYNIPAVKLVQKFGPDNMVALANRLGLKNWQVDGSYGLSVTLGGKEVRLIDLTNVYATFARGGIYKDVNGILSVKDSYGKEIFKRKQKDIEGEQVLTPEISYLITNILSDNNARRPAFGINNFLWLPNKTIAVKTGTTDMKRDNYTIGYTPSYVVSVWVGNNDNAPMNKYLASGLSGAAPIWNKVMKLVLKDDMNEDFKMPDGVLVYQDKECSNKSEVFLKDSKYPKSLCISSEKSADAENAKNKKLDKDKKV